jgi:hypothetical protein
VSRGRLTSAALAFGRTVRGPMSLLSGASDCASFLRFSAVFPGDTKN